MDYNQCSQIFIQEIALLDKIITVQNDVMNAVINREWTDFEAGSAILDEASLQFENFEEKRIADQGQSNWTQFYAEVSKLPDAQRIHLTELYRTLRLKIHRVRTSNDNLTLYLNEAKSTVEAFMDAAFPDRRGRLYGQNGTRISADMRSLLVDASV